MFFGVGAYTPLLVYTLWGWPPLAGVPLGIVRQRRAGARDRHADLPADRALFLHGDDRGRRTDPHRRRQLGLRRRRDRPAGPGDWRAPGGISPSAAQCRTTTSSSPCCAVVLVVTAMIERSRIGYYLRAISASERAARSLGVPVRRTKCTR